MDELLNAKEARKILKVSLALVYRMAERGQLPCVRWECPGEGEKRQKSMVRFKKQDLIEFVEKHYRNGHL
jgi:transposase